MRFSFASKLVILLLKKMSIEFLVHSVFFSYAYVSTFVIMYDINAFYLN